MENFAITSEINKIQICVNLVAMLKKQLHRVLQQTTILDNQLTNLLRRYDFAEKNRCFSVRANLAIRIAVMEGVRNMLNEWARGRSAEIVRLQRMVLVHERALIERIQYGHGDEDEFEAYYGDFEGQNNEIMDDLYDDELSWDPDDYSAIDSDVDREDDTENEQFVFNVGTSSNSYIRS